MNRRALLKGAGAIAVLVVGGGVWRAYREGVFSTGTGPAYEPWRSWRADAAEGPLALVRAAILAASPHNTQPWLFRVSEARIELYADTARNLGTFDPYLREMHIGLGCAVENMMLAAAAYGYRATVALNEGILEAIPGQPPGSLVAALDLSRGPGSRDELYDAIPRRHTNRGAYDIGRPVPREVVDSVREIAGDDADLRVFVFSGETERKRFGEAAVTATETIIADTAMVDDSQRWFRHRWAEVQAARDGLTLEAAGLAPLVTAAAKVLPAPSAETSHRYWLDATRDVQVPSTPVFGMIAVRALYDRPQTLRAGRAWQRIHLLATARGLAAQPVNQPVEMVDRERQLGKEPLAGRVLAGLTGDAAWKPTFAFRMGFPRRPAPPSPRRPVEAVVL